MEIGYYHRIHVYRDDNSCFIDLYDVMTMFIDELTIWFREKICQRPTDGRGFPWNSCCLIVSCYNAGCRRIREILLSAT